MENIDAATPFTLTIKQFMLIIDDLVSSLKLALLPMKTTQVATCHRWLTINLCYHLDTLISILDFFSTISLHPL